MPRSAIKHVGVNYVLPISEIGPLLNRLAREEAGVEGSMSTSEDRPDILERIMDGTGDASKLGKPSGLTCPECGGSLSEKADGDLITYQCRVGHAYSPAHLDAAQSTAVEDALWASVRALQERADLMRRMAAEMESVGNGQVAGGFREKADRAKHHVELVQQVFLRQRSGEDKNALMS